MAQAWRSRMPNSHFTAVGAAHDPAAWSTATIERDAEELTDADWQQLGAAQCWLFPETLERLRDPWTFLARLRRQANGPVELIACVNNGQNWLVQALLAAGNLNYQAGGVPDRRNLHLFTRTSLAALMQECGFSLVAMSTVNTQQPLPAVLDAIRALAATTGTDPELAVQDALPYQYLVRAIAA
jgi:hypothetical protein